MCVRRVRGFAGVLSAICRRIRVYVSCRPAWSECSSFQIRDCWARLPCSQLHGFALLYSWPRLVNGSASIQPEPWHQLHSISASVFECASRCRRIWYQFGHLVWPWFCHSRHAALAVVESYCLSRSAHWSRTFVLRSNGAMAGRMRSAHASRNVSALWESISAPRFDGRPPFWHRCGQVVTVCRLLARPLGGRLRRLPCLRCWRSSDGGV